MSKEVATLKAEIKQLKQERNTAISMLYRSNYKKLRGVDGQPIFNMYKCVGHITKVCRQSNREVTNPEGITINPSGETTLLTKIIEGDHRVRKQ